MSEIGHPFMDLSGDLLVLDTLVVADCTTVESVQKIEKIGQQICDSFYQDRLIARTKQLNDRGETTTVSDMVTKINQGSKIR